MTFYATELDICPAYGWQGGPDIDVLIRQLRNKHERRNRRGDLVQHRYTLPLQDIDDAEYLLYVKSAFLALGGPHHSFLVKDHLDYAVAAESLGSAPSGSTPVQLRKTSTFGLASYVRVINKPVAGAVVYQGGVAKAGALDTLTGLFTPSSAWSVGAPLTWTGEFRVPVRFETGFLPATLDDRLGTGFAVNLSLSLVEVFGE